MAHFNFKEGKWDEGNREWYWSNEELDEKFFGGLGPMNTVADYIMELNDCLFRDILGDETMDRPLGSFKQDDLFKIMARIFLSTGFERWARIELND